MVNFDEKLESTKELILPISKGVKKAARDKSMSQECGCLRKSKEHGWHGETETKESREKMTEK